MTEVHYAAALLLLWSAGDSAGIGLYRQRQFAAAEKALRATLKARPHDESTRLYLARTLIELRRVAEAVRELEPLTGPAAGVEARLEAGRLLRQLAERRFQELQRTAGGTAATLEIAGRRLEREGKFAAALEQYQAVQQMEPDRPGIRYAIGGVLWKLRDLPGAERELAAELARQPSHGMANLRLGQVLLAADRAQEAVPLLERARAALPHILDIQRELGKAYQKSGRLSEARAAWEGLARARPGDDQVHYLLSSLYREINEPELARRELQLHREILERRRERP